VLKDVTKKADGRRRRDPAPDPVPALKALAHPLRFVLLGLLAGGERCVCDLVDYTGASQPLVSHHLSVLKKAGLIHDRQDSTWVYYSVDAENWEALQSSLADIRPANVPSPPCPPEDGA